MNATLNELVEFLEKLAESLDDWSELSVFDTDLFDKDTFDGTAVEVRRMAAKIRKSVEVNPSDA